MSGHFDVSDDIITLRVRLTPNARTEGVGGVYHDGDNVCWLKASVRVVPENGKANSALIKLLAKQLKIPKSTITILSGTTSRTKKLSFPDHESSRQALEKLAQA